MDRDSRVSIYLLSTIAQNILKCNHVTLKLVFNTVNTYEAAIYFVKLAYRILSRNLYIGKMSK